MKAFYQYKLFSEILDEKMKPEYVFDIFLKWVSNKVTGDDLEKMAHNMLHEAWRKQREE